MTAFLFKSGLMKPWPPAVGAFTRSARSMAYAPAAQLDEYAAWPLLIARSEPIADASLPDIRARSRPGIAIAAMMPMIATTISSSIRVKPFTLRIFICLSSEKNLVLLDVRPDVERACQSPQQAWCQGSSVIVSL